MWLIVISIIISIIDFFLIRRGTELEKPYAVTSKEDANFALFIIICPIMNFILLGLIIVEELKKLDFTLLFKKKK